ncbi:MAG: hypothetical protein R2939_13805 [Kofleriaceae bacterium]
MTTRDLTFPVARGQGATSSLVYVTIAVGLALMQALFVARTVGASMVAVAAIGGGAAAVVLGLAGWWWSRRRRAPAPTVALRGDALVVSWWPQPLALGSATITVGSWTIAGLDTPRGAYLEVVGGGRRLRLGAAVDHRAHGATGAPQHKVDGELAPEAFTHLVEALRGPAAPAPGNQVELVARRSALGMMAPWLLTIVGVSAWSLLLAALVPIERLSSTPGGMLLVFGPIVGGIGVGIAVTMRKAGRARRPALVLQLDDDGVSQWRQGVLEASRPWGALRVTRARYELRSRYYQATFPVIEIAPRAGQAGDVIRVVGWDRGVAWPDATPRRYRAPPYLLEAASWRRLVRLLGSHLD